MYVVSVILISRDRQAVVERETMRPFEIGYILRSDAKIPLMKTPFVAGVLLLAVG